MRCFTLQRCEIRTAASLLWNAAPGEASSGSPDAVILRRQRRRRRRRWTTTGCGSDGNKVPNFPSGTVRWCLTGRYGTVRCGAVRCGTVPTGGLDAARPSVDARPLARYQSPASLEGAARLGRCVCQDQLIARGGVIGPPGLAVAAPKARPRLACPNPYCRPAAGGRRRVQL